MEKKLLDLLEVVLQFLEDLFDGEFEVFEELVHVVRMMKNELFISLRINSKLFF